jgi:hypothetical protein
MILAPSKQRQIHTLHIQDRFIPYQHIQLFCAFTYISSITIFLCYQLQNKERAYMGQRRTINEVKIIFLYHVKIMLR